jgi:Protein of unknown function (DUF3297)
MSIDVLIAGKGIFFKPFLKSPRAPPPDRPGGPGRPGAGHPVAGLAARDGSWQMPPLPLSGNRAFRPHAAGPDPEDRAMTDTPETTPAQDTAPLPAPETLPDRLSVNPKSPWYNGPLLERGIGIRFKGVEKTNVEEYCVSEGWVRLTAGTAKDRAGNAMTVKLSGVVEPYFQA